MKNLITRKLLLDDFEILKNFFQERKTFSKQPYEGLVQENLLSKIEFSLNNPKTNNIIGTFQENVLVAVISQTFSSKHPIWFLNYYASRNSISLNRGLGEPLESCFAYSTADSESKGYYDFYVSVPIQYAKTVSILYSKSPAWSRYEFFTDAIIQENEFPKFEIHKFVYGSILKPHKVYIRHIVLKQKYRGFPLAPQ